MSSKNIDIPCLTCVSLDCVAFRYFDVHAERMDIHGPYTEVLIRWMARELDDGLRELVDWWRAQRGSMATTSCRQEVLAS